MKRAVVVALATLLAAKADAFAQTLCDEALVSCQVALGEAESLLLQTDALRSGLRRERADQDKDRKRDFDDACPQTPPGRMVDARGCSLAQFCAPFPTSNETERRTCRRADWGNDEPGANNEEDCRADTELGCVPAIPEPEAPFACHTATATVELTFDDSASATVVTIDYPSSLIGVPGTGAEVMERVTQIATVDGFFGGAENDLDQDGTDDEVLLGLITTVSEQYLPSGQFAAVEFDCLAGARAPLTSDFVCTADSSNEFGEPLGTTCAISLAVDP